MKVLNNIYQGIRSLRFILMVIVFSCIVFPVLGSITVLFDNYEKRQVNSLAVTLTSQAQLISSQIVQGGYFSNYTTLRNRLGSLKEMYAGRIMVMDKDMKILIDTYNIYEGQYMIWEKALRSAMGESVTEYDYVNHLLIVAIPIGSAEDISAGITSGVVMISRNTDSISKDAAYYDRLKNLIMIVVVIGGVFLSVILSWVLLIPISNLRKGIHGLIEDATTKLKLSRITEIKKIEEEINEYSRKRRNMDTSMNDFLSNVSHELKTPLTSMKIMADSLNASEDTPIEFYREFMVDIASEIDRETAIINDLIGLVKNEEYVSTLNPETINVNELMEDVLKTLSPLAERAGVDLLLETFKPIVMEIDKVKFSQAMINLIENAIKYNKEKGYVHVSVNSDANNCYIRIEDNGIGIPKDNLEQIFERFYRVDTSHSKEIEGTGLGLSIVKAIITLHKGQIKADSIEGAGTTFTVKLPLIRPE